MISIKRDIQTPDELGQWAYQGAKSREELHTFDSLRDELNFRKYQGIHELLVGERYRPYADVEKEVPGLGKKEFEAEEFRVLWAAKTTMERLFPDGDVMFFCASSHKKGKISGHFIVNNIYYTSKAQIRYVLKTGCDTRVTELCMDMQVYDNNKTMRIPLCSKPGEKRPLRYAELKSIGDAQFIQYPAEDEEADLASGLITYVAADEKEMPTPDGFVEEKEKEEKNEAYG
ncbi:MAG: hypothetical protein P4L51_22610, partial [Puia sp.]|nr:hypothetical protein [Puia sp.]